MKHSRLRNTAFALEPLPKGALGNRKQGDIGQMHPQTIIALLALVSAGALGGCNTMHGLGEDMRQGGIALSNAASQTQENMSSPARGTPAPAISMDRARALAL